MMTRSCRGMLCCAALRCAALVLCVGLSDVETRLTLWGLLGRVFLSATNEKVLSKISLDELKKFAAKE